MTSGSQKLLADFVRNGSEAAFRQLVERYANLVYSTAYRITGGDMPLAQDIAQTVFLDLSRMAGKLSEEVMLGGWLHRHTCFVCSTALRAERRRRKRELQAAGMNPQSAEPGLGLDPIGPLLDEAINQLNAADRQAIVSRFFEQASFRAIGEALGTNEDAAPDARVARAGETPSDITQARVRRLFRGLGGAAGWDCLDHRALRAGRHDFVRRSHRLFMRKLHHNLPKN